MEWPVNDVVAYSTIDNCEYGVHPYNPDISYPELSKDRLSYAVELDSTNAVYSAVRNVLMQLEYDPDHYGTVNWNPLKGIVVSGDNVVIKPNLVYHKHVLGALGLKAIITHASVIRPIIDYVLLATSGNCHITICDAPIQSADWQQLMDVSGLDKLVTFYKQHNVLIELLDLRYATCCKNSAGIIVKREKKAADPNGYIAVDLKTNSQLYAIADDAQKMEITDYGKGTVAKHHNRYTNEYLISGTVLNADVFINVPKLKTHKRAGVTLALKNIVGIVGDKSWIAHHRRGVDEYPKFIFSNWLLFYTNYYLKLYTPNWFCTLVYSFYRKCTKRKIVTGSNYAAKAPSCMAGSWQGNDTLWRTILDLNNILFYADKRGVMRETAQRRYIAVVDGIVGMDGEGPMDGNPLNCGLVIAGNNPAFVDIVTTHMMGFAADKFKLYAQIAKEHLWNVATLHANEISWVRYNQWRDINLSFKPSAGWKTMIRQH